MPWRTHAKYTIASRLSYFLFLSGNPACACTLLWFTALISGVIQSCQVLTVTLYSMCYRGATDMKSSPLTSFFNVLPTRLVYIEGKKGKRNKHLLPSARTSLCRVVLKTGCNIKFHQESNNGTLLCARCVIFDDTTNLSHALQSGNHQGSPWRTYTKHKSHLGVMILFQTRITKAHESFHPCFLLF